MKLWRESSPMELLQQATNVTVLTGAGVSTHAGIPDFKSTDESWPYDTPRAEMMSLKYWRSHPQQFWEAYRHLFDVKMSTETQPTPFHSWLAELQRTKTVTVLTQNVDGLHQAAGSVNVLEAHGNATMAVCVRCGTQTRMQDVEHMSTPVCESGSCNEGPGVSYLKPDVVLFGESVNNLSEFKKAMRESQLLIVAGTRLQVSPVNEMPLYAMGKAGPRRLRREYFQATLWLGEDSAPEGYSFDVEATGDLQEAVRALS